MYLTAVISHKCPRVFQLESPNCTNSSSLCTANSKAPLFLGFQTMLAHVCMYVCLEFGNGEVHTGGDKVLQINHNLEDEI